MKDDYTVSVKRFAKLTPKEIRRLKKLTFGRSGYSAMLPYLSAIEADILYARKMRAIILLNKRGVIVAWVSLRKFRITRMNPFDDTDEVEINVFTAPNYRKLGLGSILVGEAKRYATRTWRGSSLLAYAHDAGSLSFYERNKFFATGSKLPTDMRWKKA